MTTNPSSPSRSDHRRRRRGYRIAAWAVTTLAIVATVLTVGTSVASADAGHAAGITNVTTNGFTHPWMGQWATNVGLAFCIDSGSWDPRAVGNTRIGDVPATRGVSAKDRNALAYALWAYGTTTDPTTAAGMATVAHGLSGDSYASTNVPSMTVSDSSVYNSAVSIYNTAESRAFWLAGPWTLTTSLSYENGTLWSSITTVKTANGQPIVGKTITVVPYNVTTNSGDARSLVTNANGQIHASWHQADTAQPITIDAATDAPAPYSVWQGPAYAEGPAAQLVVTGNSTRYSGRGQASIPTGFGRIRKTTTNPAYQSATGATFDVQPQGGGASLGTLTVGADGTTNTLALRVGAYRVVETAAPTGVEVDPAPHTLTVSAQATTTLDLSDEVAHQATLQLVKVDAGTGATVAGATLLVRRDDDADGTYETTIGTYTTGIDPIAVPGLTAGKYRITETAPPPGYLDPTVANQEVTLRWNQTTKVTFTDHLVPRITTRAQLASTDGTPVIPGVVPSELNGSAIVFGPVGSSLRDTATVTGLAPMETGTITTVLFGPVMPGEPLVCDAAHRVWSGTWTITGSGDSTSEAYTPTRAGLYGYVETLDVPDVGKYSGRCGEITETSILTPTIATRARALRLIPGATVADTAVVTGLADGETGTIDTILYGPFTDADALAKACTAGDLGTPVRTAHYRVTGSGDSTSSGIILPSGDAGAGVYTFVETLHVPGWPITFTHACGTPPETFTVPHPPAPKKTAGAGSGASADGLAALPVTGAAAGALALLGALLCAAGLIAVTLSKRRRRSNA